MSGARGASNGTGVRVQPAGEGDLGSTGAACHHPGGSGAVWTGRWPDRRTTMTRNGHGARRSTGRRLGSCSRSPDPDQTDTPADWSGGPWRAPASSHSAWVSRSSSSATPLVGRLVPDGQAGSSPGHVGAARLGTRADGRRRPARGRHEPPGPHRRVRSRRRSGGPTPVMRAMGALPDDILVAAGVVPVEGRPIPELVIGPFGVAVVHELGRRDRLRHVGTIVGDANPRWLGPDGASARSCRARRRACPALADARRPRLRGPRLRCPGHARRDDPALTALRGHQRRSDPGVARGAPTPAQLQRRAPEPPVWRGSARPKPPRQPRRGW